jgi:hypothetical protein
MTVTDWNGDGDFDTGDLVFAFQGGGYEQGPRAEMPAVPEPAALPMLIGGWVGIGIGARRAARGPCR